MAESYLAEVATKLAIKDKKILRKANELVKLLGTQKSLPCSESCKAIACLELASQVIGSDIIPRESAIKFSGCKKTVYINMFNIISKLVNLDKVYSVKELCLTLGVAELQTVAANLFEKYKTEHIVSKEEALHPMYACAAIMVACKSNKVKVNSAKFIELSRLKKAEFETLTQKMEKLADAQPTVRRPKRTSEVAISKTITNNVPLSKKAKKKTEEELEEEYQDWKRRMLEE